MLCWNFEPGEDSSQGRNALANGQVISGAVNPSMTQDCSERGRGPEAQQGGKRKGGRERAGVVRSREQNKYKDSKQIVHSRCWCMSRGWTDQSGLLGGHYI